MYLTKKVELEEKIEGFIVYLLSVDVGVDVVSGEVYRCLGLVCLVKYTVVLVLCVDVLVGIIGCVLGVDIIGEICGDILSEICRIKV
ncbi:hypothetical protein DY000_02024459 [Brassica cretica]|uniref:Uncharacterized protein n=1 Tax=Brassica cretica TaxID=69181 RepID=A0ABQ7ECH3_BRACR|nr:hypothetical protein DY000_02024459 [Brassica cretica]